MCSVLRFGQNLKDSTILYMKCPQQVHLFTNLHLCSVILLLYINLVYFQ